MIDWFQLSTVFTVFTVFLSGGIETKLQDVGRRISASNTGEITASSASDCLVWLLDHIFF